jgi:putative peptidoglycan lipid II flippase
VSEPGSRMAGATAMLSLATLVSRILGLVREQVFAALLGAGFYGDAFAMAFRLPNLLRDLFAEGALSAAFQPTFVAEEKQRGLEAAYRLANLVMALLLCVVGALSLLGIVLAPQLVSLWAKGYSAVPGKAELTVLLTRIMMPFLLLVSLAAVAMGMLNAQKRFVAPAIAPALFNLAAVLGGGAMWLLGIGRTRTAAIGWAVATLVGGGLQLAVQLVPLRRRGFRPSLRLRWADLRDPGLRQILVSMAPATIGLMATQVNVYVSSSFASTENGAVTWLMCAFRLMQLPIGMFGVAVGTVALAQAAERANDADLKVALDGVRETMRRGLLLVCFYTLPTAVALWVLATPVLRVIYQHGAFTAADTIATAEALRYLALGLVAYSVIKVVAPVFYAVRRARVPVIATVIAVIAGVLWNLALHPRFGYRALALGTSVTAIVNMVVLLAAFSRSYGGLWRSEVVLGLCRVTVAAVISGLGMWAALSALLGKTATATGITATSTGWAIGVLALTGTAGVAIYVGLCWLMGVGELKEMREAVGRRLKRLRAR